jgi:hypothetical protein
VERATLEDGRINQPIRSTVETENCLRYGGEEPGRKRQSLFTFASCFKLNLNCKKVSALRREWAIEAESERGKYLKVGGGRKGDLSRGRTEPEHLLHPENWQNKQM